MSDNPPNLSTPISITLPQGAWHTVLSILGKSTGFAWEVTNPLIHVMQQQMMQAVQQQPRPVPRAVGDDG